MSKLWRHRVGIGDEPLHPALNESSVGLTVRISRWGGNVRVTDIGVVGRVVGVGRTRLRLEVVVGNGGGGVMVGDTLSVSPGMLFVVDEVSEEEWHRLEAEKQAAAAAAGARLRATVELRADLLKEFRRVVGLAEAAETDEEREALEFQRDEIDALIAETFA